MLLLMPIFATSLCVFVHVRVQSRVRVGSADEEHSSAPWKRLVLYKSSRIL
jgi:hypothetical protein